MARLLLVECPSCHTRGNVITSKRVSGELRELYCQCMNLNCAKVFVLHLAFSHYPKCHGGKPDPELQPELCSDDGQVDMFENETNAEN